jgi:ferric-dicitrate binding protein FerR (iron transport regulator)
VRDHLNLRRLEDLFPRYWDAALSSAERAEFERILATDPEARQAFLMLSMQAVTPAELTALATRLPAAALPPERWSRRRLLALAGGGFAAGVAALAGWRLLLRPDTMPVRLEATRGMVRLDGGEAAAGTLLLQGAVLRSVGPGSSAVLSLADGSTVSITGDSSIGVERGGRRLRLHDGSASAAFLPSGRNEPVVLATPAASVVSAGGAELTLGSAPRVTEVGVRAGQVRVSDRAGDLVDEVHQGEVLTLHPGGECKKQTLRPSPTSYRLDLARSRPDDWKVGRLVATDAGPAVAPEFWYDPYHSAVLSQVRSNNQWTRGFASLFPDSLIKVRYYVDRPGRGQVVFCVRTERVNPHDTGVVEVNDAFVNARPGEWQWLEARPRDMLAVRHAPTFGPPWVVFLLIFNTYELDLGLRVADLRVSRNGGGTNG